MNESFFLGAYWGNRKQLPGECAESVSTVLTGLMNHDLLSTWYPASSRNKQFSGAGQIDPSDITAIELLLKKGIIKNNDRTVVPELGYGLVLWNGKKHSDVFLTVRCGSYGVTPNICTLHFYEHDTFIIFDNMLSVLQTIIRSLSPENAVVTLYGIWQQLPHPMNTIPFASGWLTYRNVPVNSLSTMSPPVEVLPFEHGSLVLTTRETFDSQNEKHTNSFREVAELLSEAGLLKRM